MHSADLELLARYASARDAEALAELVARHRDMVYAACYRVLGSRADAEDSAQECFFRLARNADSIRTSVAGWLHRVAVQTSITMRKRDRARTEKERTAARMSADASTESAWGDIKAEIDRAIDELPDELRQPLLLHFLEDRSQRSVADELGLSQPAVSRRIKKGIERLRAELKQSGLIVSTAALAAMLASHAAEAAPATLIAALGKMAMAGIGSSPAHVGAAGTGVGLAAVAGAKAKIACAVAVALAAGVAVHQTVGGAASAPGQTAAVAQEPPAPQSSALEPEPPEPAEAPAPAEALVAVSSALPADPPARERKSPLVSDPGPASAVQVAQAPTDRPQTGAEAQPPIDRTDPSAVARAYIEACRAGDAEAALALLDPDDPTKLALHDAARRFARGVRPPATPRQFFTELTFLPAQVGFGAETPVLEDTGDGTTTVTVERTWNVAQKFLMKQDDDGIWSIRGLDSINATTGADESYIVWSMSQGTDTGAWQSQDRLRLLVKAFQEYAGEHDNRLPPAATWMDAIEPYILDRGCFQCPAIPESEYGYAMNALAGGLGLPRNWGDREGLLLLFEWRGAERNASAFPDELLDMEPPWPDGTIVVADATGNPDRMPRGVTFAEFVLAEDHQRQCSANLVALARAARKFARENGGMLPGAGTWRDDLALYILEQQPAGDVFRCPAAPAIDFGYAINSAVAGRDATELQKHDELILFFESDQNVPSASGDPALDASEPVRHLAVYETRRLNQIAYLSGRTAFHRPLDQ